MYVHTLLLIITIKLSRQLGIECNCAEYTNHVDCTNFNCQWDNTDHICLEFVCNQRPNDLCVTYNTLPRLAISPIYCALQNSYTNNITCVSTPKNCESMNTTTDGQNNCVLNLCQNNATQPVCQSYQNSCDNLPTCSGLVVFGREISGFCSIDSNQQCGQISYDSPCNTITEKVNCERIQNCKWMKDACITLFCSDRDINSCHKQVIPNIYYKCIPIGNSCQEVVVEGLPQKYCIKDSTIIWDTTKKSCVSCNVNRWITTQKSNSMFSSLDVTAVEITHNSNKRAIHYQGDANEVQRGQTFVKSSGSYLLGSLLVIKFIFEI